MNANKIKSKKPEMRAFSYFLSWFSFAFIRVHSRLILSYKPQYLVHDLRALLELQLQHRRDHRLQGY